MVTLKGNSTDFYTSKCVYWSRGVLLRMWEKLFSFKSDELPQVSVGKTKKSGGVELERCEVTRPL